MSRWIGGAFRVVRNITYSEERPGSTPEVLEAKYIAVEPFWVLLEPEDSGWGGFFLYTCSEDAAEKGATWYLTVTAAKAGAALEFGWRDEARWVLLAPGVCEPREFGRYWE